MTTIGPIEKMKVRPQTPVEYALPVGDQDIPLNPAIGSPVKLEWRGEIACIHCQRKIKKSFNQGYCYPCFTRLAQCDSCVIRPELCHYDAGTCREPDWGETHCLIPHTVYLANSSGLKVGITRGLDPRTRWIDQGASQGLPIRTVPTRLDAGRVEVAFKDFVADKTNWRAMLKGTPEPLDLAAEKERLFSALADKHPDLSLPGHEPASAHSMSFEYPVDEYPTRIVSHNLDKEPVLEGTLLGIKGQYLIFDTGVINMRKYAGYELALSHTAVAD
jgi:hypothetical protein